MDPEFEMAMRELLTEQHRRQRELYDAFAAEQLALAYRFDAEWAPSL